MEPAPHSSGREDAADHATTRPEYDHCMGFNPFRKQERSAMDIAMVVGALLLTAAAVGWAFFGG